MPLLLVLGAAAAALLPNTFPTLPSSPFLQPREGRAVTSIRKYFDAWNRRDMETACNCFSEDCVYDDTQYQGAFQGKEALKNHLNRVADALPPSFQFCIDDVADGGDTVGVQWHVENNGNALPFTRGCSMYRADASGLLVSGFDVPEPAPFKPGSASLLLLGVASKLIAEPIRALPLGAWVAYVSIVFFSNGILPGPDATQLDGATWEEVRRLARHSWLAWPLPQRLPQRPLPQRPLPQRPLPHSTAAPSTAAPLHTQPELWAHACAGARPLAQLLASGARPRPAVRARVAPRPRGHL